MKASRFCPKVKCLDGFEVSIQASDMHYCTPRTCDAYEYTEVELGYPSHPSGKRFIEDDILLRPFAELDADDNDMGIYHHVPVALVRELLARHGGVASGGMPAGIYLNSAGYPVPELR
tara:strand:- start:52 stop:405 length:354 start_codon:yes stop_codon:yes gene_type:complete